MNDAKADTAPIRSPYRSAVSVKTCNFLAAKVKIEFLQKWTFGESTFLFYRVHRIVPHGRFGKD